MTESQAVKAIQAQLADFQPATEARVRETIPLGTAMFCAEYQWEFMDTSATTTAALDAATGFHKIAKPDLFFKPVVLWTDTCPEVRYVNRYEFAEYQSGVSGTVSPHKYTVIGQDMFLVKPSGGETIYIIYTRDATAWNFANVPGQYHPAIIQATVMYLMPTVLVRPNGDVANPAFGRARSLYFDAVATALTLEAEDKGRPRRLEATQEMKDRTSYR